MNALTEIQTIKGPDGEPAYVVIPYAEFLKRYAKEESLIPHEVVAATVHGASPMKAWRDHLRMTQAEVAAKLGMSPPGYQQIETSEKPRIDSIKRVAAAMGITFDQLDIY